MSPNSLKAIALNGVFWTSVEKFGSQLISLVLGILIARILTPSDYGIIGMTSIFIAIGTTLIDSGFGSALIQNQERKEEDYSTCFYFNIAIGVIIYTILYLLAPYIANFYAIPLLTSVIRILGLTFILNSLTISQTAKLTIEFRFKDLSIITISSQLLTGILGLILAITGFGIWALVIQQISAAFLRFVFIEITTKWKPSLIITKVAFLRLFNYGSKITCSSIINTLYNNSYTLVIGKFFSANDVGYYSRGMQFATLPSTSLLQIIMKTAFPVMSNVQDDTERLKRAYLKFLMSTVFILYPILFSLAVLGEPLIQIVLGEKWLPCVPYLQIMCLGALFEPLTHINLNILYVKGRTDLVLKLELLKKPIGFLLLFSMIPFGIMWVCASWSIYGFVAYCFNCYYSGKFVDLDFWKQIKFFLPIIVNCIAMSILVLVCIYFIDSQILKLIIGFLIGAISYLYLAYVTHDENLAEIAQFLKNRIKR